MGDKAIYVVLIKAHTGLGSFARKVMQYPYTHIAVSLDDTFEEFITFSRKRHYLPMDAGFMRETRACYAYGEHKSVQVKIFKLPTTENEMKKILVYINLVEQDDAYLFNLFSMVTMPLVRGFRIYKTHNCMTFVGKLLTFIDGVTLNKPYYKYTIKDIDKLLSARFIFEGELSKTGKEPLRYMEKVSLKIKAKAGAGLLKNLTKRMLFPNDERQI